MSMSMSMSTNLALAPHPWPISRFRCHASEIHGSGIVSDAQYFVQSGGTEVLSGDGARLCMESTRQSLFQDCGGGQWSIWSNRKRGPCEAGAPWR